MTNREIRSMDCSDRKVVLVKGTQAMYVRNNQTASHLKIEFLLQDFLDGSEDLHLFMEDDAEAKAEVCKLLQKMGHDFSKAVEFHSPSRPLLPPRSVS